MLSVRQIIKCSWTISSRVYINCFNYQPKCKLDHGLIIFLILNARISIIPLFSQPPTPTPPPGLFYQNFTFYQDRIYLFYFFIFDLILIILKIIVSFNLISLYISSFIKEKHFLSTRVDLNCKLFTYCLLLKSWIVFVACAKVLNFIDFFPGLMPINFFVIVLLFHSQ